VQLQLEVPVPSAHRLFTIDNKRFIEVALMTFDGNHDGEMTEFDFTPADIAGGQSGDLMNLNDLLLLNTGIQQTPHRLRDEFYIQSCDQLFNMVDPERQHTSDRKDCPGCATLAQEVTSDLTSMSSMAFDEAFLYWSAARKRDLSIRKRTHETDREYANALSKFFGKILMGNINAGHIAMYQRARCANRLPVNGHLCAPWNRDACHGRVNHELSLLSGYKSNRFNWMLLPPKSLSESDV
jgi:hypothetical protein